MRTPFKPGNARISGDDGGRYCGRTDGGEGSADFRRNHASVGEKRVPVRTCTLLTSFLVLCFEMLNGYISFSPSTPLINFSTSRP